MNEDQLKRLVELKKELEAKKANLEKELELLKINLEIIDAAITERSFVTADTLIKTKTEEKPKVEEKPKPTLIRSEKILDIDNFVLATLNIFDDNHVEIIPSSELKFKEDISPFKNFLVKKVLEGKKASDADAGLPAEKSFDYVIKKDQEENVVEIYLKNIDVNDAQEMRNLTGSLKWTFKRIREKLKSS